LIADCNKADLTLQEQVLLTFSTQTKQMEASLQQGIICVTTLANTSRASLPRSWRPAFKNLCDNMREKP